MTTLSLVEISQLNQLLFVVFASGVFTGAICTGFLKTLLNLITLHFEHPSRIKTNDGYLYRFKRKYVSLDEKQRLIKQAVEQHRALKNEKKTSA
ncbi:hypothetical protein [Acinetobacter gyllenbergii]|uniref:hypothetical protein n=1 Tax=Acinetobacter gyllenbergii TaxID=134534 RepID=UPI000806CBA5|nr:hypothetical protein [Acinetobacter gyllenbergii]OBY72366.1 hypothetical protein NG55_20255 [Acinetobacter gyllenbergii]